MIKEITFVTQYFAPAWGYGGPPKVLYTLAKELVKLGIKINVITTDVLDEERNLILYEVLDKIEIFRSRTLSNYAAYKNKLIYAPNVLDQSKQIIDNSDLVLFSDLRAIINWQIYPYVLKQKIPYGIFAFGEIPYGQGIKSIIKKLFDEVWVNNFVKNAKWLFVQTEHEREMYETYFEAPKEIIKFLPLPVETKHIKVDKKLLEYYKRKWGIDDNDKVILYVGRLHLLKGIDLLISAVIPLLQRNPYLKLLIVGRDDGEASKLRNLFVKQMKKQIIFTGPLYEKDVVCVYNIASCFVITPRFYEETSLAALEALSHGVPVIVSKQADIPYLEKYQAGYVVHNNSDSIKKAIMQILEKVKKNKTLIKKNAQRLISEKFSPTVVVQQMLSIINNCV